MKIRTSSKVDETAVVRERLQARLREIRRFLRGEASEPPSADLLCIWLELAYILECDDDAIELFQRISEAEADPYLYGRVRRLVRVARQRAGRRGLSSDGDAAETGAAPA